MIKEIYRNIGYLYFPKDIDSITQKNEYVQTSEYKRLLELTLYFLNNNNLDEVLKMIREILNFDFKDISMLNWQDRCFTLEYVELEENKLYRTIVYMSIIIPVYYVEVLENEINHETKMWKTSPVKVKLLENEKFKNNLFKVSQLLESKFFYTKFPSYLINENIDDLTFQDIRKGDFTFFNLFFTNENI